MKLERESALRALANRRVFAVLLLGFSSGLPIMLTTTTLQAWLADHGIGLRALGAATLVGLPYTLKFLWAPLLDRFALPVLGRRRGWILLSQLLLAAAIAGFTLLDPAAAPVRMAALAVSLAFLSASQDVVVDAYRADVLSAEERGTGAAASVAGYRIATILSGAVALICADLFGWRQTLLGLALLMACMGLATWFAPEPKAPVRSPHTLVEAVVEPLREFLSRRHALLFLLLIIGYKLGDALALALSTPFLKNIGYTNTDIGVVSKGFGLAATLVGVFAGGALLARIGLFRALLWLGLVQCLTLLPYAVLAQGAHDKFSLVWTIGLQNLGDGMGTAAFLAFLMALCSLRFSAFQYALFSALFSQGRVLFGPFAGMLAPRTGWVAYFSGCCGIGLCALTLVWALRLQLQRLDQSPHP